MAILTIFVANVDLMNTIGQLFRITTFGESHGPAIGAVIDGCPAGLKINLDSIAKEMRRRKPGQSAITTNRMEDDQVELLSGVYNNTTLGTPIALLIRNKDHRPEDYEWLKNSYRPGHADYTYEKKYGIRDYRGGGRASARTTAAIVAAGAIAQQLLNRSGIRTEAFVTKLGTTAWQIPEERLVTADVKALKALALKREKSIVRCPDKQTSASMIAYLSELQQKGDTCGGVISTLVYGVPLGLGEPLFDKLSSRLSAAMLSSNAVHGFEFGSGFNAVTMLGSQHNDPIIIKNKTFQTSTNNSGGILGGISNGMPIFFNVAFKPISTIMAAQQTVDKSNKPLIQKAKGRHDPCAVPRAVPIVEAMTNLVLVDLLLLNSNAKCF